MSDLQDLYQQLIIDHGRNPRNFGRLDKANYQHEGFNPLCGDRITVYLFVEAGLVKNASFEGSGCAISVATASLMTEALKGKTLAGIENIFAQFRELITGNAYNAEALGKLAALAGVAEYPMRVKCATLCWHTTLAALNQAEKSVSTE